MTIKNKNLIRELFIEGVPPKQIASVVGTTASGVRYYTSPMRKGMEILPSERKIMIMMANGMTNKDIAKELNVTPESVGQNRADLIRKLKLKNSCQLVAWGFKNKYLI